MIATFPCSCESHDDTCLLNHALVAFDKHELDVHEFDQRTNRFPVDERMRPTKPHVVLDGYFIIAARVKDEWGVWKWHEADGAFTLRSIGRPLQVAQALADVWGRD